MQWYGQNDVRNVGQEIDIGEENNKAKRKENTRQKAKNKK